MKNDFDDQRKPQMHSKRGKWRNLFFTTVATVALPGEVPAQDTSVHLKTPQATTDPRLAPISPDIQLKLLNRQEWFKQKIDSPSLKDDERAMLEKALINNTMSLDLQLAFLRKDMGEGGHYYKLWQGNPLSDEHRSKILSLISRVSTQLTLEFKRNPLNPEFKHLFDISKLKNAARTTNEGGFCNEFFARRTDNAGRTRVWSVTAAHCMSKEIIGKYHVSSTSDHAVRLIPPSHYEANGIKDVGDLPLLYTRARASQMSGKPSVSYSWWLDDKGGLTEKVEFSIFFPLREQDRAGMSIKNSAKLFVKITPNHFHNAISHLAPPEEGKRIWRWVRIRPNSKIRIKRDVGLVGSGKSGSIFAMNLETNEGLGAVSALSIIGEVADKCGNRCYTEVTASDPRELGRLIDKVEADELKLMERGWTAGMTVQAGPKDDPAR